MNSLCFSTKIRRKASMFTSPLPCNIVLKILASAVTEAKEMKNIQMGEYVKMSLFAHDMFSYKKLFEIYIKFTKISNRKIVGKKVNSKKNLEINPCCCMYSSI